MEPNENHLSSFFHHHQQHQQQQHHHQQPQQQSTTAVTSTTTTTTPTNGILSNSDGSHNILYPHSVASAVSSQLEPGKRKRGRPRKYGTPEQALAAKKASTSSFSDNNNNNNSFSPSSPSFSSKKSHSLPLGNAGQGFSAHVIAVAAGEDVGQKIMQFMQQNRGEICVLSASGSISNASLRQPASSGGNITYEGRFDIISLTGSYVRNETGGRGGGLSVCLSNSDGQIIGGGIGGPLKAAGPVQVIVASFFLNTKKDTSAGVKGDASASTLPSPPVGESVSNLGFHQTVDRSSGNPIRGNDAHQAMGGSHFMIQQLGLHVTPPRSTDWGSHPDSRHTGYDLSGRTGHGSHQSPKNGGYDQIPD